MMTRAALETYLRQNWVRWYTWGERGGAIRQVRLPPAGGGWGGVNEVWRWKHMGGPYDNPEGYTWIRGHSTSTPHTHPNAEIFTLIFGSATIRNGKRSRSTRMQVGVPVRIPPNRRHDIRAGKG